MCDLRRRGSSCLDGSEAAGQVSVDAGLVKRHASVAVSSKGRRFLGYHKKTEGNRLFTLVLCTAAAEGCKLLMPLPCIAAVVAYVLAHPSSVFLSSYRQIRYGRKVVFYMHFVAWFLLVLGLLTLLVEKSLST